MKFINLRIVVLTAIFIWLFSISCFPQSKEKVVSNAQKTNNQTVKTTPAYAELLLRKTELESLLEDFSVGYTEDYPKVKETRYELNVIQRDLAKLLTVSDAETSKLTLALGKLMVRRAALETDAWNLQTKYGDEHPDVKRAKRRVSSFDKAIAEILP